MNKFYEIIQNNSGGSFDVNKKLCHRLIIEANTDLEALSIAEDLGCYWNGVEEGRDCECCGDRWYESANKIDLDEINTRGYEVSVYDSEDSPEEAWLQKYGDYDILEKPEWKESYFLRSYEGKIRFKTIVEYVQFLADQYGWTSPDARIFYLNGDVEEVYKKNDENYILENLKKKQI